MLAYDYRFLRLIRFLIDMSILYGRSDRQCKNIFFCVHHFMLWMSFGEPEKCQYGTFTVT